MSVLIARLKSRAGAFWQAVSAYRNDAVEAGVRGKHVLVFMGVTTLCIVLQVLMLRLQHEPSQLVGWFRVGILAFTSGCLGTQINLCYWLVQRVRSKRRRLAATEAAIATLLRYQAEHKTMVQTLSVSIEPQADQVMIEAGWLEHHLIATRQSTIVPCSGSGTIVEHVMGRQARLREDVSDEDALFVMPTISDRLVFGSVGSTVTMRVPYQCGRKALDEIVGLLGLRLEPIYFSHPQPSPRTFRLLSI